METSFYIIGSVIGFVLLCWGALAIAVKLINEQLSYSEAQSKLRGLRRVYNRYSLEERESKIGKQVLRAIHYLEKRLKHLESLPGRSTRGGGNYKSQLS